jgi:DNA invertase Pin-like site-specific DNA recombinase
MNTGKPSLTHIQPPETACDAVAYFRVSTSQQGRSGLGLEAQQKAVSDFLNVKDWHLAGSYTEVESGKRKDRPELAEAIAHAKRIKGKLVIAKLDRLARNVHFIAGLMETGVDFVAVDMPTADKFMLHVYAAMAEEEGRRISQRTKAALAAAKARGVELGKNGKVLAERHKAEAVAFAATLLPTITEIHNEGHRTVRAVTKALNGRGIPSREGGLWHLASTQNLLRRNNCT